MQWAVTVKSDIWTLGLIALQLMTCSQITATEFAALWANTATLWGPEALQDIDTEQKTDTCAPFSFKTIPDMYSIKLYRIVEKMLNYVPENRPSLKYLRLVIDPTLKKLDRMYGDKLVPENVAEDAQNDFYVWYQSGGYKPADHFKIDAETPAKRRVPDDFNLGDEGKARALDFYRANVENWNNLYKNLYSQVTEEDLREVWNDMEYTLKQNDRVPPWTLSIIRKRMSPTLAQDHYRAEDKGEAGYVRNEATQRKRFVLREITEMQDLDVGSMHLQPAQDVIKAACNWGLEVIAMGVFPERYRARHLSLMHLAVRDLIFYEP